MEKQEKAKHGKGINYDFFFFELQDDSAEY